MKDPGNLRHFFGLEVKYESEQLVLHQHKYIIDLFICFGMHECKPEVTLADTNSKIYANKSRELEDATMYRKIVGVSSILL